MAPDESGHGNDLGMPVLGRGQQASPTRQTPHTQRSTRMHALMNVVSCDTRKQTADNIELRRFYLAGAQIDMDTDRSGSRLCDVHTVVAPKSVNLQLVDRLAARDVGESR
jgi:hypothetical protein